MLFNTCTRLIRAVNASNVVVGAVRYQSSIMNKRAVVKSLMSPIVVDEVPIADPPPKGCVIKISHAGLCHSDVSIWKDKTMARMVTFPWVGGHEICGEIYTTGNEQLAGDEKFMVGDKVMVYPWCGCYKCENCDTGDTNLCHRGGLDAYGVFVKPGGFQQYVSVHDRNLLVRVPDAVPMDVAALLPCSGLTAYNAVTSALDRAHDFIKRYGDCQILVVGAGGLGLWAIRMIKVLYPDKCNIAVADISEDKMQMAKEAGADQTVCWQKTDDDRTAMKKTLTLLGKRPRICFDFVNVTQTNNKIINLLTPGGHYVMIGILALQSEVLTRLIAAKALSIQGINVGTQSQLQKLTSIVVKHQLKSPPLEYVTLEQLDEAANRLHEGRVQGRIVVLPHAATSSGARL